MSIDAASIAVIEVDFNFGDGSLKPRGYEDLQELVEVRAVIVVVDFIESDILLHERRGLSGGCGEFEFEAIARCDGEACEISPERSRPTPLYRAIISRRRIRGEEQGRKWCRDVTNEGLGGKTVGSATCKGPPLFHVTGDLES